MAQIIALFGEAEKGRFQIPYALQELSQLIDLLGNPPLDSQGLFFAIQAILYQKDLIYFRVQEEGLSHADYLKGLHSLHTVPQLHALGLPGVSDPTILNAAGAICEKYSSILIFSEKDLYDYLTGNS